MNLHASLLTFVRTYSILCPEAWRTQASSGICCLAYAKLFLHSGNILHLGEALPMGRGSVLPQPEQFQCLVMTALIVLELTY